MLPKVYRCTLFTHSEILLHVPLLFFLSPSECYCSFQLVFLPSLPFPLFLILYSANLFFLVKGDQPVVKAPNGKLPERWRPILNAKVFMLLRIQRALNEVSFAMVWRPTDHHGDGLQRALYNLFLVCIENWSRGCQERKGPSWQLLLKWNQQRWIAVVHLAVNTTNTGWVYLGCACGWTCCVT